ncbi:MAG: TetR/AcrR family transcriptional regulator [Nitrososphaerota archaeon]|nr:TetR/AcrR family transcriptional regulator [Nitrososphaerota archaeon]
MKAKLGSAAILEVAGKLFAEKGYANVSIRDVCREAKTTPPMIYYYFKDKRRLFEAAVNHRVTMQEFIRLLRDRTTTNSVKENVERFVDIYLSSFPTEAFQPGLYMVETAELDRTSAEKISEELDEVRKVAISLVKRGIARGAFRKTDPKSAADCLIGMLNHVVFQRFHFSRTGDLDKSKDAIVDFFLRAMVV